MQEIPVTTTYQVPVKTMEINQSTAKGNADAMDCLLDQGGVSDPAECLQQNNINISQYVLLFHGNLATLERVQSVQESHSLDDTPYHCYQYVVFILGLFHMKMACANAIWCMLIQSKQSHIDCSSWMQEYAIFHPKETGKMSSNPGFCRLHEAIQHTGIAMQLDCWHKEVQKIYNQHTSLEKYVSSKPTWEEIMDISHTLLCKYVTYENFAEKH